MQNLDEGHRLARRFRDAGLVHDRQRTHLIAGWAYEQGQANRAQLWIRQREFEPCDYSWKAALGISGGLRLAAEEPPPPYE